MSKLHCLMLTIVMSLSAGFAVSQETAKPVSTLSPSDVKQLKEAASGLREVFGIEGPSKPATASATPANAKTSDSESSKKSVADVADKALDMAGKMVAQAAETMQKVAPDVWRIMVKQQYATAAAYLITPVGIMFVVVFFFVPMVKRWPWSTKDELRGDEKFSNTALLKVIPTIVLTVCCIWFCIALAISAKYLINPEFYAIRDMLMMILGKGGQIG